MSSGLQMSTVKTYSDEITEVELSGTLLHQLILGSTMNLWHYSPEEPRQTEVVAARLQYRATTVGQVVACMPVMQWAWVRSPVGTSFLGEVFSGFFLTCKTNVGKL